MEEIIDFSKELDRVEDSELLSMKKALDDKTIYRENEFYLFDCDKVIEESPEVYDIFQNNPRDFLEKLKLEILDRTNRDFHIKFINLKEEEQISNLRIEHLDKIVKISGMLSNATKVLGLVKSRKYNCPSCGTIISIKGPEEPKRCSCGRKGGFEIIKTYYQNMQEIVLEESQDEIGDRAPRRTRVRLVDQLCDKKMNGIIKDGNKIEVIGMVEEIPLKKDNKTKDEIYEFRIFALDIKSLENEFDESITDEDIDKIKNISESEPLKTLSDSLAPDIVGLNEVKRACVLSLVGGVPVIKKNGKREKHRIHGLLIGDAGQAKTVILNETTRRSYKGKYVSGEGNAISKVGITASVEKDELLGTWALKAGYLPRNNGGIVGIDELDKADKDIQKSLHTPMESGIVTISKAGINATLNADCTIICSANPKNSKFDVSKPLVPQINMEETLLSRYDWIFVMRDTIDEDRDKLIVDSIWEDEESVDTIPVNLFRKYIKYCQKFKPKVTDEAKKIISDFYIEIRKLSRGSDNLEGMPIIARHAKALKRMAEAHAKLRLKDFVDKEDATVAIKLFKDSLLKLGLDEEEGVIDFARIGPGQTVNKKHKFERLLKIIKDLSNNDRNVKEEDILIYSYENGIKPDETNKLLEELHRAGEIFSPRRKVWALM